MTNINLNNENHVTNSSKAATTDALRRVKDIAISMLESPVNPSETNPTYVEHPVLTSRMAWFPDDNSFGDILTDASALQKEIQIRKALIEESDSLDDILNLIRSSYRLQFRKLIENTLSSKELGELLAFVWIYDKKVNTHDVLLSIQTFIEWFKKADKASLMNAEELAYYNSLPDKFTVYRGIGSKPRKNGISYTLSKEIAEQFANRFRKGCVLTGTACKKDVFAYFNGRNEQEILIETQNIIDLHEM